MPSNTRVTATDFVQDYAAKRQAQLERAKRIREERMQQQQHDTTPPSVPRTTPDAGKGNPQRCILQVVEEDFTRATQAGIITPDQARQLWAMFSNQIIRVSASHPVVGLDAVLGLSHAASTQSSQASSTGAAGGFGGSISMESLRRSIAQFKEQQQRHAHQARDERDGVEQDAAVGLLRRKGRNERPEWNFDTAVSAPHPDDVAAVVADRAERRKNEVKVHERTAKTGPTLERRRTTTTAEPGEDAGDESESRPNAVLHRKNSHPKPTAGVSVAPRGGGPAVTVIKRPQPPHPTSVAPTSLDDVPVGAHNGTWGSSAMPDPTRARPPAALTPDRAKVGDVNQGIAREAAAAAAEPLRPCSCCGRTFRASLLARHEALCRKQSKKSRKAFDMRGQRLDGVEGMEEVLRSNQYHAVEAKKGRGAGSRAETGAAQSQKMAKWRLQHEQFQAAMRAVRSQAQAEKDYGAAGSMFGTGQHMPAPPPPLPAELDSRVPCPHCGRKFAEETAKRHIPHCANTIAKPKGIRPIRR